MALAGGAHARSEERRRRGPLPRMGWVVVAARSVAARGHIMIQNSALHCTSLVTGSIGS